MWADNEAENRPACSTSLWTARTSPSPSQDSMPCRPIARDIRRHMYSGKDGPRSAYSGRYLLMDRQVEVDAAYCGGDAICSTSTLQATSCSSSRGTRRDGLRLVGAAMISVPRNTWPVGSERSLKRCKPSWYGSMSPSISAHAHAHCAAPTYATSPAPDPTRASSPPLSHGIGYAGTRAGDVPAPPTATGCGCSQISHPVGKLFRAESTTSNSVRDVTALTGGPPDRPRPFGSFDEEAQTLANFR